MRRYKLAPRRFHLLHGYNGSGTSSLGEALDLLLTCSIERLDRNEKARYFASFIRLVADRVMRTRLSPRGARATVAAAVDASQGDLRIAAPHGPIRAKVSIRPPDGTGEEEPRHRWSPAPVTPLPSAAERAPLAWSSTSSTPNPVNIHHRPLLLLNPFA